METNWLIAGLGAGVLVLTILFASWPSARKTIVFFGSAVGVAAAVLGVLFSFQELQRLGDQYKLAIGQHEQSVTHSRQAVTFSYTEKFEDLPLEKAAEALNQIGAMNPQQISEFFRADPVSSQALLKVFNFFEQMALATKNSYADEKTLCALFEEPAVRYYSHLSSWIVEYRKQTGRHGAHEQHEWLFERWRRGCPQ